MDLQLPLMNLSQAAPSVLIAQAHMHELHGRNKEMQVSINASGVVSGSPDSPTVPEMARKLRFSPNSPGGFSPMSPRGFSPNSPGWGVGVGGGFGSRPNMGSGFGGRQPSMGGRQPGVGGGGMQMNMGSGRRPSMGDMGRQPSMDPRMGPVPGIGPVPGMGPVPGSQQRNFDTAPSGPSTGTAPQPSIGSGRVAPASTSQRSGSLALKDTNDSPAPTKAPKSKAKKPEPSAPAPSPNNTVSQPASFPSQSSQPPVSTPSERSILSSGVSSWNAWVLGTFHLLI